MEFMTNKDGSEATRIGDTLYVLLPHRGQVRIASSWTHKAPADLSDSDFHGFDLHPDMEAAKAELADIAAHVAEKAAFGYRETASSTRTPWGASQGKTVLTEGVESHHTAGHGGYKLDRRHNAMVHPAWRQPGGWYEEDCEWAIVAATFPQLFTARERRRADTTARNWFPDAYEAVNGVVLAEGESSVKDERAFKERHKNDWIVVAATGQDNGTVLCTATLGGERERHDGPPVETKDFLLAKGEYSMGRFGFVIDLGRHAEYTAPEAGMTP